jgi:CRISPR type III-A-associated RAMP protein Csm4
MQLPFDPKSQEYLTNNAKLFKKINFVSLDVIKTIQDGGELSFSEVHIIDNVYLVTDKDLAQLGLSPFLELAENPESHLKPQKKAIDRKIAIYTIMEEQKVRIDRLSQESEPFTWSKFKFQNSKYYVLSQDEPLFYELQPGFYFFLAIQGFPSEWVEKITSAIRLIADEGIGGKRSLGCGLVDAIELTPINDEFEYNSLFNDVKGNNYINISVVHPTADDMDFIPFFTLYDRSGFVYSMDNTSTRIKDCKFIGEGSVFTKKVQGKIVSVAPEEFKKNNHPVYKYGIGLYVSVGSTIANEVNE